ncbi:hypothetical protein [Savagea faecisuis]|uniref:Zinc ribbon domain-containing protein n=1 Tax=Savagea faecisuis TaxID=1274803 RepID=A0ABW3H4I0_9BACL
MKVCQTCQAGVKRSEKVCPYCSASLKSWKRPTYWGIGIAIIVLLLSPIFIHVYMDKVTSPTKQIDAMINGLERDDYPMFAEAVGAPLELDEQAQQLVLDYMKDQSLSDFKKRTTRITARAKRDNKNTYVHHEDGSAILDVKVSKYNVFYNKVEIELREPVIQWVASHE